MARGAGGQPAALPDAAVESAPVSHAGEIIFAVALLAAPLPVEAQPAGKVYRVGTL